MYVAGDTPCFDCNAMNFIDGMFHVVPNSASCSIIDGKCDFTCASGWTDQNGSPLDGCEVAPDYSSDVMNCGGNGNVVPHEIEF